ncbi:hypothetical protein RHMOL_Rhmol10G0054100 [Rhododendron molle]|uniref:Uncharacterized protein n=1 Tax=Rhododendron molle TaxID=49168 RepID=A0ACC0LZA3_RHOML|nr:hypothetical protein RHMOL_Rhmol10G0054100 [Rhododendron molle]
MRVVTWVHHACAAAVVDGADEGLEGPVGRKLATSEVLERVFWTPFATTARRFLPPSAAAVGCSSFGGVAL